MTAGTCYPLFIIWLRIACAVGLVLTGTYVWVRSHYKPFLWNRQSMIAIRSDGSRSEFNANKVPWRTQCEGAVVTCDLWRVQMSQGGIAIEQIGMTQDFREQGAYDAGRRSFCRNYFKIIGMPADGSTVLAALAQYPTLHPKLRGDEMRGAGFGVVWSRRSLSNTAVAYQRAVLLPCWFVVVSFGILSLQPITTLVRRTYRVQEGRCRDCGYDLRATPDGCP